MLVCWVMSSLRLPLECSPKMGLVSFRLLISLWLVFDYVFMSRRYLPKIHESSPLVRLLLVGLTSDSSGSAHEYKNFGDLQFSLVILNYKRTLTWLFRVCLLFFFFFIYFFFFFNFSFLWAFQLCSSWGQPKGSVFNCYYNEV